MRPCDRASAGISANPADALVTVLFTPVGGGTRNAVVLTAGSCSSLSSQLTACGSQLGGGLALCIEGSAAGVNVAQRPDGAHLQFLFPNTDAFVGGIGDDLTLAGPATIAVTQTTAASLPCACHLLPAARHECEFQGGERHANKAGFFVRSGFCAGGDAGWIAPRPGSQRRRTQTLTSCRISRDVLRCTLDRSSERKEALMRAAALLVGTLAVGRVAAAQLPEIVSATPTVAAAQLLCSAGPTDGQSCGGDGDCAGGACVQARGICKAGVPFRGRWPRGRGDRALADRQHRPRTA
jgi:hypothetical protein